MPAPPSTAAMNRPTGSRVAGSMTTALRDHVLVLVAGLAIAADLLVRRAELPTWSGQMWLVFGGSALASLLVASALVWSVRAVRTRSPLLAGIIVVTSSVAWTWVVVLSLGYFVNMGSLPVSSAVRYLLQEPRSTWSLIAPYLRDPGVLAPMVGAPAVVAGLWWLASRPGDRRDPARRLRMGPPLLAVAIIISLSLKPPSYRFAVADVHAVLLTTNMARLATKGQAQRLSKPHRLHLGELARPAKRPNVLLIVNETYGSSAISLYGCKANTTPQTDAFVRANAATVTVFPDAQSNAGSTLVSLPSLFSGLAPTRTAIELHTAPLLWNVAKAAGYRTFLHTAQDLNWLQLDLFLLDSDLDSAYHAGKTKLPVVNDIGIADEQMMATTIAHIEQLAADRTQPFFGVVQFNATHSPHAWHPGHDHHFDKVATRQAAKHLDTVAFVDELTGRLLTRLKHLGLLDNTVVALTADHGHNLIPTRLPDRLHNYYEPVHRVPFWLHLPLQVRTPAVTAQLKANTGRRVSNLDITPTLFAAMGLQGELPATVTTPLDGHSLLGPLPEDRVLPFVNNTEIRQASRRGFTLVVRDRKYLFFERESGCEEHLYDWRTDPDEQRDLWPLATAAERKLWYGRIQGYPLLHRARMLGPCPPDASGV